MKAEYRLFAGVSLFLFLAAAVYSWWTWTDSGGTDGGSVEFIGTVALIMAGLLCAMCGGYFWFVSRRIDARPEDRPDAEIADGVGDIGFFSPSSYWPFGVALAAMVTSIGTAFWMPWLIAAGVLAILASASGLLFEYYTGTRRSVEH